MAHKPGISVGQFSFTDLLYTDDRTMFLPSTADTSPCLASFSQTAASLGLEVSWPKTKLQNLGHGPQPPNTDVGGNLVESVDSFVYLGSLQSSDGCCHPDLNRHISFATFTMASLSCVWKYKRLTVSTKIRLYQALVVSVLVYAAETWTLLAADVRTLEAFHMRCQCQILGIRWYHYIRNDEVAFRTGLPPIVDHISNRRCALFAHIARLPESVPANQALRCHVNASLG